MDVFWIISSFPSRRNFIDRHIQAPPRPHARTTVNVVNDQEQRQQLPLAAVAARQEPGPNKMLVKAVIQPLSHAHFLFYLKLMTFEDGE